MKTTEVAPESRTRAIGMECHLKSEYYFRQ